MGIKAAFLAMGVFAFVLVLAYLIARVAEAAGWRRIAATLRLVGAFLIFCALLGGVTAWVSCAPRPAPVPILMDPGRGGHPDPSQEFGCARDSVS